MGVPSSEVGYTSAMPRREDHEVRKGHVGALDKKKIYDLFKVCVPRSKHSPFRLYKTYLLMLYKEKVHTKQLNAM